MRLTAFHGTLFTLFTLVGGDEERSVEYMSEAIRRCKHIEPGEVVTDGETLALTGIGRK